MKSLAKISLAVIGALALSATAASAAIVCNDEGDCWHIKGRAAYKPELKLHIYDDNWKWKEHEKYKWREHEGHGYWRGGVWIGL